MKIVLTNTIAIMIMRLDLDKVPLVNTVSFNYLGVHFI